MKFLDKIDRNTIWTIVFVIVLAVVGIGVHWVVPWMKHDNYIEKNPHKETALVGVTKPAQSL